MRREDYERSYGRRGVPMQMPTPVSPSHDSQHSRKSRRKMKCLITVGLILPVLAAVIGVAAWAVSADVVMSSGSGANKADNQLLQNVPNPRSTDQDDIFRSNSRFSENHGSQQRPPEGNHPLPSDKTTLVPRLTPSTSTLSPQEPTDVGSIISKLISASGAASGGNGPRFVVVAPLPDHGPTNSESSPVSRADHINAKVEGSPPLRHDLRDVHRGKKHDDLMASGSEIRHQTEPFRLVANATNRIGIPAGSSSSSPRRSGDQHFVVDVSTNNHRLGSKTQSLEMSGFEPFMSPQALLGIGSVHQPGSAPPPPPSPNYVASGSFNGNSKMRQPPQGFFGSRGQSHKHQLTSHSSHPHGPPPGPPPPHHLHTMPGPPNKHSLGGFDPPAYNPHKLSGVNGRGGNPGSFGLKPIQKHIHGVEPLHPLPNTDKNFHGPPPRADESNRWGSLPFHSGEFGHKPPDGISLSISAPSGEFSPHGHSEPVSVIKSFFLPFLPKPKVNLNARVVFGVVLDKGIGLGGQKKEAGPLHHPLY